MVEVDHVFVFEADLAPEMLAHNALPGGVELLVKLSLQFFRKLHVCNVVVAALLREPQFHELYGLELHVYTRGGSGKEMAVTLWHVAEFNHRFVCHLKLIFINSLCFLGET